MAGFAISKTTTVLVRFAIFVSSSISATSQGVDTIQQAAETTIVDSLLHEVSAALGSISSADHDTRAEQTSQDQLGEKLLEEISTALGNGTTGGEGGEGFRVSAHRDVPELEAELQPIFKALPSQSERFGAVAVRYALHRLFVRRHGWFVVGLEPEGQAWNKTSPSKIAVLEQMPEAVRVLIEQRLHGLGLVAKQVAVLAALVEYFVHQEAFHRLSSVYRLMDFPLNGTGAENIAPLAVEIYMASYIIGRDPTKTTKKGLQRQYAVIDKVYPTWPRTRDFVKDTYMKEQASAKLGDVGFPTANRAIQQIGEKYGVWQNGECQDLKTMLMGVEDKGTGRVRLADFYGAALHDGKWQFKESVSYLRQLGALDESNPSNLRVIMANYINGHSNCIASSQYFSNCCISECESILAHLERELGVPEAHPSDIVSTVSVLPSSTVSANRTLSVTMLHRLNAIAASHNGQVPLYGRLFAQWLHHAYPRECPYPHMSGKTNPQQLKDWARAGGSPTASPEEMRAIAGATPAEKPRSPRGVEEAPWSYEEELFVPRSSDDEPTAWLALNAVVLVAGVAVATLGFTLSKATRAARRALRATKATHNILDSFCAV